MGLITIIQVLWIWDPSSILTRKKRLVYRINKRVASHCFSGLEIYFFEEADLEMYYLIDVEFIAWEWEIKQQIKTKTWEWVNTSILFFIFSADFEMQVFFNVFVYI